MATTPLQALTIPSGTDAPAGNTNFGTFGGEVEKKIVMTYASAAARDAAIPTINRVEGMTAYLNDTNMWTGWDGVSWVELGGKRQWGYTWVRATTDSFATTGAFVAMSVGGSVANAPAGDWELSWSVCIKNSVTGAGNFRAICNGTNVSGDVGCDMIADTRVIVSWTAPYQLAAVGTLGLETWYLGTGAGTGTIYIGSRANACYLGPR